MQIPLANTSLLLLDGQLNLPTESTNPLLRGERTGAEDSRVLVRLSVVLAPSFNVYFIDIQLIDHLSFHA